jgi:hypothetical protein
MPNELWIKIIDDILKNPRDLQTTPIINRGGVWFSVTTDGKTISVDNAKTEKPSSRIGPTREICKDEFIKMHPIYLRRKRGEKVSKEATNTTINQVYIYSIFKYCGGI